METIHKNIRFAYFFSSFFFFFVVYFFIGFYCGSNYSTGVFSVCLEKERTIWCRRRSQVFQISQKTTIFGGKNYDIFLRSEVQTGDVEEWQRNEVQTNDVEKQQLVWEYVTLTGRNSTLKFLVTFMICFINSTSTIFK